MPCIFTNLESTYAPLNILNKYSLGGIKKVWICTYEDLNGYVLIQNNILKDITKALQWFPLSLSRDTTKFSEVLNIEKNTYTHTFEFDIVHMQPNRKVSIQNLISGTWTFILQDLNDYYWIVGLNKGMKRTAYSSTTDVYKGAGGYKFSFATESNSLLMGVHEDYIEDSVDVALPCTLLDSEIALESEYYIFQFENCLIGDLPSFVEPS